MPEDRLHDGLVSGFTVAENLVLDLYHREPYSHGMSLDLERIRQNAEERVEEFDVRTADGRAHRRDPVRAATSRR